MHTMDFELPDIGRCAIHYNQDWSGDAIVHWGHETRPFEHYQHEMVVPGAILLFVMKQSALEYVRGEVVRCLEGLAPTFKNRVEWPGAPGDLWHVKREGKAVRARVLLREDTHCLVETLDVPSYMFNVADPSDFLCRIAPEREKHD